MTDKTLSIKYVGDASSLKNTLGQIEKAHASLGSQLQSVGRSMSSAGRSMSVGLTLPVVAGFKVAIDEATQFNQVQAQTSAALKSTGGAANVSLGHIDSLSHSIGALTAQDGEVVHSMENILLTFPAVRNEVGKGNNIFDQASLSVANLSARMGTDMNSAAVFVGKALGNPIKGLTALTRVGVEFDAQQIKTIKHMVNSGNTMGAQKVILGELNKEFGGSAKAMGDTASPLTKLNLAFRDLAQQVGPIVISIVQQITGRLQVIFTWFSKLSPGIQHAIVVVAALAAALGPVLMVFGALTRGIGLAMNAYAVMVRVMAANPYAFLIIATILVVTLIVTHWKQVKAIITTIWRGILAVGTTIWHALYKALSFTPIIAIIRGELAVLKAVFGPAISFIVSHWSGAWKAMGAVVHGFASVVSGIWGAIVGAIKAGLNAVISVINGLIHAYNIVPFHADIPTIPHLAKGAQYFRGGLALLGEHGPELAMLPRGAQVLSAAQTRRTLERGGTGAGGGTVTINQHFQIDVHGSTTKEITDGVRRELLAMKRRGTDLFGTRATA